MAIEDVTKENNGILRFNLTYLRGDAGMDCVAVSQDTPRLVARWYYQHRLTGNDVASVLLSLGKYAYTPFVYDRI